MLDSLLNEVPSEISLQIRYVQGQILIVCTGSSGEIFVSLDDTGVKRLLKRSIKFHNFTDELVERKNKDELLPKQRKRFSQYLKLLGQYIFDLVFRTKVLDIINSEDVIYDLLNVAIGQAIQQGTNVRIRLAIATDFLNIVPWELMHDSDTFLCHSYDVYRHPFVLQPVRRPISPRQKPKVLLVTANPYGDIFIQNQISSVNKVSDLIDVDILKDGKANHTNIANHIFDGIDILHFLAHGEYNATNGQGHFIIDGEDNEVSAKLPVEMLQSFCRVNPMQLVILSACRSDQAFLYNQDTLDNLVESNYFSMAHALIKAGVTCVIGMSHPISKRAAEIMVRRLYHVVVIQGGSIATAMRQIRLELYAHMDSLLPSDWLAPILYSRGSLFSIRSFKKEK